MHYRKSKSNYISYKIVSQISYLIRYALCCITIEKVPIFESETLQWIWSIALGGVIYTILWAICYLLVNFTSNKIDVTDSCQKSILYFLLYLPLIFITFLILKILTVYGILPISNNITFNLFDFLGEKFAQLIMFLWGIIVKVTEGISNSLTS